MENQLIVIHEYPCNNLTPFLQPVSKHTQSSLPKIYGSKVRKRLFTQPGQTDYPQPHYLRPCCHSNHDSITPRQITLSKTNKLSSALIQPKKQHCNKKGCACHQQHFLQQKKKKQKRAGNRQKSVVLPSVKHFRAGDLQQAETNHKVMNNRVHAMSMDEMELIEPTRGDRYKVGRAMITRSGRESSSSGVQTQPQQVLNKAKTDQDHLQIKAVRDRKDRSFQPGRPYYEHLEQGRSRKSYSRKKGLYTDSEQSFPIEEAQARNFSTLFHKKKQAQGMSIRFSKKGQQSMILSNGLFRIPEDDQLGQYLLNFKPINPMIDMKKLVKKPTFQILPHKDRLYFGEVKEGARHGLGVSITEKEVFEGQFVNNRKTKGFERNRDGVYQGEYMRGKRHGWGTFKWANGETFEGQWSDGKKNGHGVWRSPKGDFYEGAWKENRQNGKGSYCHAGGSTYRGYFVDFLKHGKGEESFPNGDKYIGPYQKGKPQGYGKYKWANGNEYEGQFVDGQREGRGILKSANGQLYEGQFEGDAKHGYGQQRYPSGERFEGQFRDGERYEGVLISSQGAKVQITPTK